MSSFRRPPRRPCCSAVAGGSIPTIIASNEMTEKRKYELRQRAERLAETRRRITEATVELHRTVGPAATQINEIARRAGVQRMTVYNHFPDESQLLTTCSAHWRALHPSPDLAGWRAVAEPGARLRRGLCELYSWYRETEPMTANVLRDAEIVPALRPIVRNGLLRYLDEARRVLTEPVEADGRGQERVDAAVRGVTDFHFWRALAPLGDADAAELAAGLVERAADAAPAPTSPVPRRPG
jgi:AcrR family transcriptional regulator